MSPQKFVKQPPIGYRLEEVPDLNKFERIRSHSYGFDLVYLFNRITYTPEHKIAVRLPDGRIVIPTVKGEKSK